MLFKPVKDSNSSTILDKYILYLNSVKGSSPDTIKGYKSDLIMFFRFLKVYYRDYSISENFDLKYDLYQVPIEDIDIEYIKKIEIEDIYSFMNFIEKYRDNNPRTRARKVACIKSFYKYLHKKLKIIDNDITKDLETPKLPFRTPIHLNEEECYALLNCIKSRNAVRDKCIITLFLNTGMRLSELCSIDLKDIEQDTIYIIGKGNKERPVALNSACRKALDRYLLHRTLIKEKIIPGHEDALFLSERKKRISKRTVEQAITNAVKSAMLSNKYSTHKLRHTAATLMYRAGADIRTLQALLGHESVATTQIYTHVNEEQLKQITEINPLNNS